MPLLKDEMMNELNDRDLNRLLNVASLPDGTEQGMTNLLKRINSHQPEIRQKNAYWLSALPLAASLALGLYLGASGFDFINTTDTADLSSGIEDVETVALEGQS
jgi:hypothetical protein